MKPSRGVGGENHLLIGRFEKTSDFLLSLEKFLIVTGTQPSVLYFNRSGGEFYFLSY